MWRHFGKDIGLCVMAIRKAACLYIMCFHIIRVSFSSYYILREWDGVGWGVNAMTTSTKMCAKQHEKAACVIARHYLCMMAMLANTCATDSPLPPPPPPPLLYDDDDDTTNRFKYKDIINSRLCVCVCVS